MADRQQSLHSMTKPNVPPLSAEERRFTCIHEAAHAVVHGVAGMSLMGVKVADVGATSFQSAGPTHLTLVSAWGMESFEGNPVMPTFMPWTEEHGYRGNRPGFEEYLEFLDTQVESDPVFSVGIRQLLCAHLCAVLAGQIAESMARGTAVDSDLEHERGELGDMARVSGLLDFITNTRDEHPAALRHFQGETGNLLCEPDVWAAVTRIADVLEAQGEIGNEELMQLAPEWRPTWPKPPVRPEP